MSQEDIKNWTVVGKMTKRQIDVVKNLGKYTSGWSGRGFVLNYNYPALGGTKYNNTKYYLVEDTSPFKTYGTTRWALFNSKYVYCGWHNENDVLPKLVKEWNFKDKLKKLGLDSDQADTLIKI